MAADEKKSQPTITCAKNGPYLVRGLGEFRNSFGEPIPTKEALALCRCGASRTKPFCDGTHSKAGFSDEKLPGRQPDRRDDYEGKRITIHDNRGICSHAGHCTDGLPKVWRMRTEPWIDPDGAGPDEIVEVVRRCPSGALSHSVEGEEHRDQERSPAIQLTRDGPFRVTGGVELTGVPRLQGTSTEHFALCRCGGSKNKPFCDGTHWYVRFRDSESRVRSAGETRTVWYKAAETDEVPEGGVKSVAAGAQTLVLVHQQGSYRALQGTCPHQGGPMGEGSLESGELRCPWHGWGFKPGTGEATTAGRPGLETFEVEEREDGVYVAVEERVTAVRTVANVMVETMVNWGVSHVFGMVGHSNLGLADAIRIESERGYLTYIGIRHEGAAAFACSAFAKLSGRPAACLTIAGPGATNLLTGLWDAHVDRAPVLALTGQVQTQVLGPGAFQEIDQTSAFEAVASWSQTVLPTSRHAELMNLALKHAIVQRGVAHLIFPDEVQVLAVPEETPASGAEGRIADPEIAPPPQTVAAAAKLLGEAKRPVVIVGHGARGAMDRVLALAESLGAPVLTTFKAKGQIPDDHPLAGGVLGRSGTPIAAGLMSEADLLVVFGASFADHTGIDRAKRIVQVDFDRLALGKLHPVTVPMWGEIGVSAEALHQTLPASLAATDQRPDVAERWRLWREEKARRRSRDRGRGIGSATVFEALTRRAPEDAVIAVDVGNNTYSFGRYFECRRQSVLMSGYLGSIGFGFPAAMGAWAAAPGRPILAVCGDGGFGQYLAEFTTAVKYAMNITVLLLNNSELGKISKEQRAGRWPVWETSLQNPSFARFAEDCGGLGIRVTQSSDLESALDRALAHEGPALVEVITDPELI